MVTARSYMHRRAICIATLAAIYNRHRQYIWSDNSIRRGEAGLERAGLYNPISMTGILRPVTLYRALRRDVND
jgi:hypothetical protein